MRKPSLPRQRPQAMFRRTTAVLSVFICATLTCLAVSAVTAQAQRSQRGPQSVAPVAEGLIKAVVNISTSQLAKGPRGVPLPKVPKDSPFEEFFEDFFKREGPGPRLRRNVSSLGSGFVIDGQEGLVVTNHHVIADADEIVVNFHDGSKLKVVEVLGQDPKTDLALLKVKPKKPLPEVSFGESGSLKVGDWVMAIGNPFGLGGSVTVGIISAKQRDINSGPYDDFLQTDAAINKGNSGGPLFNMDGEVIGVNTAIISPTGGSIGIGFAVPSDTAVNVIHQLRKFGETRRGWLGVKIQSVTEDIAETLGVTGATGALIAAVTPDSPAAQGGIKSGDVITAFDGKPITGARALPRIVARTPIDKTVDVELLRKGKKTIVKVRVGRLVEDETKALAKATLNNDDSKDAGALKARALIGLQLKKLDKKLREEFRLDATVKGVVVTEVDPDSPAARKRIRPGDVIVEVAQDKVRSPEDVANSIERVRKSGRRAVLMRIEDAKGDLRFVAVPLR